MKAIFTKYIGPSNVRGARVKASDEDRNSITLGWNHSLNSEENHRGAAIALIRKMKWNPTEIIGGSLKNGYVWTMTQYRPGYPVERFKVNPLKRGYSRKTISRNISREIRRGKKRTAAVAMSLRSARASFKRRHPGKKLVRRLKRNPAHRQGADSIAAHELALYAINDSGLYRQQIQPIILNLRRKIKRGVYDPILALKLWRYAADNAAKRYNKEYSGRTAGYGIFSVATRELAAKEIADHYSSEVGVKNPRVRGRQFSEKRRKLIRENRQGLHRQMVREETKSRQIFVQVQTGSDSWKTLALVKDTPELRSFAKRFALSYKRKHPANIVRVCSG